MEAFEAWCERHGIHPPHTTGVVGEGWRGVIARTDIAAGDVLLSVPQQLLITAHSARRDPQLGPLLQQHPNLTSYQVLCVHLLHEAAKEDASLWAPYIRVLPRAYTLLACWPPEARAALQLPLAQAAAAAAHDAARDAWAAARPLLQQLALPPKWQSWPAFRWAWCTVYSRTMYLSDDPAGALTPWGDLHNHGHAPAPFTPRMGVAPPAAQQQQPLEGAGEDGACWGDGSLDAAAGMYRLYARSSYRAEQQVLLLYGRHPNLELLELYGFASDDNPHDKAPLPPHLFSDTCTREPLAEAHCWLHADGHPCWEMLAALRRNAASQADLKAAGHLALAGEPVSAQSEQHALGWLRTACERQLQSLPTSINDDHRALQQMQSEAADAAAAGGQEQQPEPDGGPPPEQLAAECMRLAVLWRLTYKRTLARARLHITAAAATQ